MNKEQKKNVQYDAYAKYILSQKEVLARILKFTIAEFQDLEAEVIMELIEGEPLVSKVSTEPGETNQTFHDKISGNNTENTELEEGTIFFDVIFYVRMKDGVSRIIINLEAQGIEKPPYPLVNRTVFYSARLISSRKNRNFDHSNYGDMLRTYSIWICFNLDENCMNYLHLTNTPLLGSHEWMGDLDLMNIFLVGLDKNLSEKALKTTDSDLHYMLGTTYGIEERGIKKGIEQGVKQERLNIVKNMLLQHMPVEDIKKYSGATDGEILEAEESLCVK